MKILKDYISETYLLLSIVFYWSLTALTINWFAIGLLVILGVFTFTKNQILGIVIGSFLILINLYMYLALASEFMEFDTFNNKAKDLLIYGVTYLTLNLIFSVNILYKYARISAKRNVIIIKE